MTIAILCPTKGRPEQFKRMVGSVMRTTSGEAVVHAAYDQKESGDYSKVLGTGKWHAVYQPDGMPTVHKWNLLAEMAMQNKDDSLFMLAADDIIFATPLWDKAIIDHYNALENKIHVYALQDSRDPEGTPHQIVTREWIETMGWFCPPIFLHWYTDTWTTEIARSAGVFTHMKDYLLTHDKPSDRGEGDATHTGIRAMGWLERDKWVAKHCSDWLEGQKKKLFVLVHDKKMEALAKRLQA